MIIQIIPAQPGWYAIFDKEKPDLNRVEVVCWALTEDEDGYRSVEGLAAWTEEGIDLIEHCQNFVHYQKMA